jgi:hypothetical protein
MPAIRLTLISEFNRSQALLSLAFPTLYPQGEADFIAPRQRSITYDRYIEHAWKYHDGRFARHPRFRYVVFNTLMRMQVNARSTTPSLSGMAVVSQPQSTYNSFALLSI